MTQLRDHNTYNGDFVLFFLFFSFKQEDEIKVPEDFPTSIEKFLELHFFKDKDG